LEAGKLVWWDSSAELSQKIFKLNRKFSELKSLHERRIEAPELQSFPASQPGENPPEKHLNLIDNIT
jgi:hypothetical protein